MRRGPRGGPRHARRKPDSCRGGGGGLLGTETRDAVAAEKSLIIHSAGGGTPPGARTPDTGPSDRPATLPSRPRARARATAACEEERTHLSRARPAPRPTPTRAVSRPTRFAPRPSSPPPPPASAPPPAFGNFRQDTRGPNTRRRLRRWTRLYVCGARTHAQTPSSPPSSVSSPPPPPAPAGVRPSSSCARALVPPLPMPRETGGYRGAGEEQ